MSDMSEMSGRARGRGAALLDAFTELVRIELTGVRRTWRGPVLLGAALVTGVGSPVVARLMPELLAGTLGEVAAGAVPPPVVADAWAQWIKNASSLLLVALVVVAASAIAGERGSGVAPAELAGQGPRGRSVYVLAKAVAVGLSAALAVVLLSALTCAAVTAALFEGVTGPEAGRGAAAAALWGLGALVTLGLTLLVSACSRATVLPAAVGVVLSLLGPTAAVWEPLARWSPLGLAPMASSLASSWDALSWGPVWTGGAAVVLLVAGAVLLLRRAEL